MIRGGSSDSFPYGARSAIRIGNRTGEPMDVHVAVRAANAELPPVGLPESQRRVDESEAPGPSRPSIPWKAAGYAVTVPANDRVEVRIPASTARAGTACFQLGAVEAARPAVADAAEVALPVFTPATTEAFAVYGEVDEDGAIRQPLRPPADVIPGYGGLEVTMSSTALQTLADAFLYLIEYPYECSEQIASRILSVAALRDVLAAFNAPGLPPTEEIERSMEHAFETLKGMQDASGGFPIWRRGGAVWPYHSVHVTHALVRARQKGYSVPAELLGPSIEYLRHTERNIPEWIGLGARRALIAYALYVGKLLREDSAANEREFAGEVRSGNLSWEGLEWLLGYDDGDYLLLHSHRRTDAVLLEALIADRPESDLIAKLVRGLLGHRTKGRWANTQENVWVLLAMDRYFRTFEAQEPDFMARVWLGERYAAGHAFRGRSVDNVHLDVPMPVIRESGTGGEGDLPLIVQKKGAGRLYYRLGLRYAPADLDLDSADHGFSVQRAYEAVDDPMDVRRDEDGVWHIRAGARVRVKLTMVVPSRRVHVALVDALPAGLEVLNPELAVTGKVPQDPNDGGYERRWWSTWFEHQNLRDERAEAFASLVRAGVYEDGYAARAATPGTFVVPSARAEEMYAPETFGRSATSRVVVRDDRAAVGGD